MKHYKIFAKVPDERGNYFLDEIEELAVDYKITDEDMRYLKGLAKSLHPDCISIEIYELIMDRDVQ